MLQKDYETGYDMLEKYQGLEHFLFDKIVHLKRFCPEDIVEIKRFVSSSKNVDFVYRVILEDVPWESYKKLVIYQRKGMFKLCRISECVDEVLESLGVAS